MFGWLRNGLAAENKQLRQELLQLKAAGGSEPDVIASSAGPGPISNLTNPGESREQLSHFRGWVYVAIRAIAQRAAAQECFVANEARARKMGGMVGKAVGNNLEPLAAHPLLTAIANPNELMTRFQLMYVTIAGLQLTGMAHWWMREEPGGLSIWPLPAHWMWPEHDGDNLFVRWLVRPDRSAKPFTLPGDSVCFFHFPDPADPLSALSPLASQARAVLADEALQAAQEFTFQNTVHPSIVLKAGRLPGVVGADGTRPNLTPEQRTQLITAIRKAFAGVHKRGEPLILDGLIEEATRFATSAVEMDFLNSGKATKSRILQAYGVNDIIVGDTSNANRAQAVVAEQNFANNVINPLLAFLGQTLTMFVAPRFSRGSEKLRVYFDPAVARDDELDVKKWTLAVQRGLVTTNEARRFLLNLGDVPGGDVLLAPMSMPAPGGAKRFNLRAPFDPTLNPYTLKSLGASTNGHSR